MPVWITPARLDVVILKDMIARGAHIHRERGDEPDVGVFR
jgi:hypothetical protein